MSVLFARTVILYVLVIIAMRIMGKRQIGELQPSELVVTIMISDLASIPMQTSGVPILAGVIPILTLVVAEIMLSFIALKFPKMRKVISGEISVVVHNGKINHNEMEKLRMNMDDLMEELRLANCPNVKDVQLAMVETNGKLSVQPKKSAQESQQNLQTSPSNE
ncbi:MAG: DUF421 domain-containing protein [Clostridiales bacterium]|jgi:uncharacterized membrane protein YcaP (DUF421 family)|nr:DUF421 domain-containing protein [Clostridiales bacterium]